MKHSARNLVLTLIAVYQCLIQAYSQTQTASLRPGQQMLWHRISPSSEKLDGPVLYQLLFNASATPGTVPVFDTNPRHLTNSPITVIGGNLFVGGDRGLSINGKTGLIIFASGQTFPGATGVNSVNSADNFIVVGGTATNPTVGLNTANTDARYLALTGGTMTGNITFAAGQTFPATGLPNLAGEVTGPPGATVVSNAVAANTVNAIVRRDGTGNFSAGSAALAGVLALPHTTSASVGTVTLGPAPFLHSFGSQNTFVGAFAGNFGMTGGGNTGVGYLALNSDTSGDLNSAFGAIALVNNTTGGGNSAFGSQALAANTTGTDNSAFGLYALQSNTASFNSAFGKGALQSNTSADYNSAFGFLALNSNTTGEGNAAFGNYALFKNTEGRSNAAFGGGALQANTTGTANSAFGTQALNDNTTGADNSAFGAGALVLNNGGHSNVAIGEALRNLTTGSSNIAIGNDAGLNLTAGESNNIYIGNLGMAGESNTIRIGTTPNQTATFIAGINGTTSASGVNVFVNSAGQLGTATSSRRFKQDIADLGNESDVLLKLRPVAFYYKSEFDSSHTRQYGLVAEEVAQIAPGLVVFDKDGQPETVRYHFVNAMLLNEVQKQRRLIEEQQRLMEQQQKENEEMQLQLKQVMLRLAAVEKSVPATQLANAQ